MSTALMANLSGFYLAWIRGSMPDLPSARSATLDGMWFLRIGIMLAGLGLAPFGMYVTCDGAVFLGVSCASWIVPLALVQVDLAADAAPALPRFTAGPLFALAALTAAVSVAAMAFMWGPYL